VEDADGLGRDEHLALIGAAARIVLAEALDEFA
jgi:hypothetical protein